MLKEQEDVQLLNQAEYLNVTDQQLKTIREHTERDDELQALKRS